MTVAALPGLPLAGHRILVTRSRDQSAALTRRLEQLGADVVELPAIEIVPADPAPIDAAIQQIDCYDWIVFTSANGVAAFADRVESVSGGTHRLESVRIGAIGTATATALRDRGWRVDFVPERFVAESTVEGLNAAGVSGKRVLLPVADIARDILPLGLRAAGAVVDVVTAYRTRLPDDLDEVAVQRELDRVDIATFASPSAVRNTITLIGGTLPGVRVVCIGPVTADAARAAGLNVAVVAGEYTIPGLVDAILTLVEGDAKEVLDDESAH